MHNINNVPHTRARASQEHRQRCCSCFLIEPDDKQGYACASMSTNPFHSLSVLAHFYFAVFHLQARSLPNTPTIAGGLVTSRRLRETRHRGCWALVGVNLSRQHTRSNPRCLPRWCSPPLRRRRYRRLEKSIQPAAPEHPLPCHLPRRRLPVWLRTLANGLP